MMLEVAIGESIAVRFDDGIEETRLNPEQVEDYLTRMARTAGKMYNDLDITADTPDETRP